MSEHFMEPAPGRSARDRVMRPTHVQIERELEVLSQWMDNQFRIPVIGWRFGLNAVIDLIPGIGDVMTTIVALYVLVSAVRYRVPKITLLRMALNIAIYFVIGLLPWIGDLFAAWWKPNIRNITLLRRRATVSAEEARHGRTSDWLFIGVIILVLFGALAGSLLAFYLVLRFVAANLR